MAANLKNKTPGEGHNSKRDPVYCKKVVQEFDTIVTPLENQIKALQKQITDAKGKVKKETGINFGDLMFSRKMAKMEKLEEKQDKLDAMKLVYEALSPGDTVNWLDDDTAKAKKSKKDKTKRD